METNISDGKESSIQEEENAKEEKEYTESCQSHSDFW